LGGEQWRSLKYSIFKILLKLSSVFSWCARASIFTTPSAASIIVVVSHWS